MIIVGGVYYEQPYGLLKPLRTDLLGSGGRAAIALSAEIPITLYSYFNSKSEHEFRVANSCRKNIKLITGRIEKQVFFYYQHPLSVPMIYPNPLEITQNKSFIIEDKNSTVLRFGMLEGDAFVDCDTAIYDPQNTYNPQLFSKNGSKAKKLAIILNENEAKKLSGRSDENEMGQWLLEKECADVVVIKCGAQGACVFEKGSIIKIPCYKTKLVAPIGTGDIFSAIFALKWAVNKCSATESARIASAAVADYCERSSFPLIIANSASEITNSPITKFEKRKIYLAGPFFSISQLWMIIEARNALFSIGLDVFSPVHDVGVGSAKDVVPKDINAIKDCNGLFAIASGLDAGTIFEIGYARALGKPVVVFVENEKEESLKMIEGSGCTICYDFATAVYQARWMFDE